MRTPKKGDKCEWSEWSNKTMRRERPCNVRHLEGRPPGQLMAIKQGREHVLMCSGHVLKMHAGCTGPIRAKAVKRQKPGHKDAEQVDLVEAVKAVHDSNRIEAATGINIITYDYSPMPEVD